MVPKNPVNADDFNQSQIQSLDDSEIIKRIVGGENQLYALIVRKYNQRLYRIGLSIINVESEVEDVMQSSYIKAYENLAKFKFKSSFSTWLTKILVNECLLHLKKKERSLSRAQSKLLPEFYHNPVDMQTPLLNVLNRELKIILETSIRQLPEKYRTVFIMREMENISVAETMDCLGLSEANVKVRLNRAKVLLRKALRGYLRDEEILQLYITHCDRMVENVMQKIQTEKREDKS
jgi:RNA polymerase sigma factor (sigma-70 family)